MKLEGNAGVRHLVALASMALESSAIPGGPTRAPSAPEAGTQSSRHSNGTLRWAVQLISCGLMEIRADRGSVVTLAADWQTALGGERHICLDPDCIKNLLEPGDGHRLVFTLFITADHLLAHA